ncbi:fructose-2,6-bisphosphatase [Brachyspira hampsonii]|uniref:Fructose-2,6-bisphosphatase n=1 Tax=Brachyspira hampsonii TaxID=1287055 RepID=A0AAC9TUV2_9SPIR|nr:histidine phosphatase family protein [Brachyspira hampsonii]ASJ21923.1 fructose-2,6-bisphosphatase [Brachyspira hampsonii]MBW5381352.1 histidine phosphatase family protein [Brachyspira hampsonii]OEJ18662.1 fructose-2,6-bisphosphatase [Brachyspira hampsonii]
MKILFIRHGQTQLNAEGRWLGSTDAPLCEDGKKALNDRKKIIDNYKPVEKLYCSPLKRCLETADIYFSDMQKEVLNDLRERSFGDFEGKNHDELKNNPYYKEFFRTNWKSNVPNGETSENFFSRTEKAYLYIIEDMKKNNLDYTAIVSHGGVIMSIFSRFDKQKLGFYDYLLQNGCGYYTEIDEKNNISIIEKL